MSIKRYLFMLIGGIVIGIAILQLVLISFFKQHLNQEIVEKSQKLSTEIIDFAVENINLEHNGIVFRHISEDQDVQLIEHSEQQVIERQPMAEKEKCVVKKSLVNNKDTQVEVICQQQDFISLSPEQQQENQQQRLLLRQKLHQIIEQRHLGEKQRRAITLVKGSPDHIKQVETQHISNSDSDAVNTLVNYMIILILASSALALFIALWLSHHFTRPLQQLSRGFEQLENGQFGIQIKAQGIHEYRKTMNSFNQMSANLEKLSKAQQTLQQQSHLAELGEVSRGLAHALRNPMHTIGLSVEQLKDPDLPAALRNKLQNKIQLKIKHIDKTIKALLTLTSAEIHRTDQVPIHSVIQDVLLEMKANGSEVKLNFQSNKATDLNLTGAESEIRAIIHTLIVNAIEANHNHGQVDIELTQQADHIKVTVKDQGQGIEPSIADKLFQPHISTKAEGAGMGLYISRRLATLYYGGDITLVNGPERGCIASVTFSTGSQDE